MLLAGLPVVAQGPVRVEGRVVRLASGDTVAARGARVVLHRVGRGTQGPADSTFADAAGRFRFAVRPDTTAVYLLSARFAGLEYFSAPLAPGRGGPAATGLTLVVSDTSSAAPVEIASRVLLIGAPGTGGERTILDVLVFRNRGPLTRVAADSTTSTLTVGLPPASLRTTVEERGSEISPGAVEIRDGVLRVLAPLPPGSKQLMLSHAVGADLTRLGVPFGGPVAEVTVMTEEDGTTVSGGGLAEGERAMVEGRAVRRWTGAVGVGDEIAIGFISGSPTSTRGILAALVVVVLAGLGMGLARGARQRPQATALVDELAALDARYRGRDPEVSAEEWQRYLDERGRLKARLVLTMRLPSRSSPLRLYAFLFVVLPALSCGPASEQAGPIALIDDAGDTVRLARPAVRLASLVPATTELLFALGAGASVVGRTTWCDWPPEAGRVPSLGDGIEPNLEAILGVRPDLVVLYDSPRNAEAAERLRGLGVPAVRLRTDRLEDVARAITLLGLATGRSDEASRLAEAFARDLARADRGAQNGPTVLIVAWDQPPIAIGKGSFLHEIVERAGARNAFADLDLPSAPVGIETVARRDPDLILTTSEAPSFAGLPAWQVVRAVRERRFLRVTGSEFARPSLRAAEAIRKLAAALDSVARP
jgi:ABC-type Fe3+-hydroxamate transport system substrate-binding protein